jgi:TM2 domain-containing membrane protein YozV
LSTHSTPRWTMAAVRRFDIIYAQRRNPYMVAWWSASFPGFGHLLMYKNATGVLLTLSEVIINSLANINLAMVYSFSGNFAMAKQVLHPGWLFGYMFIYFFAIWDSYRSSIEANKHYELAILENGRIPVHLMRSTGIQFLEKKRPLIAAYCSFLFPGLGQLYNKHIWLGFYGILWWWIYLTFSHFYEALIALILGHNQMVVSILNPQWLMFMPSVLGGAMYHSYTSAIEQNRLFRITQRQYLNDYYEKARIAQMNGTEINSPLLMIGTFEHCTELEQALSMLEHRGIHPSRIRPVLMDVDADKSLSIVDQRFDHTAKSVEIGFASATACSVLGISLGFILEWGPIIWGLIYGFGGFLLGFGIGLLIKSKHSLPHQKHKLPEVTVLVQYLNEEESALIHETFWRYKAITVGKIDRKHADSAL